MRDRIIIRLIRFVSRLMGNKRSYLLVYYNDAEKQEIEPRYISTSCSGRTLMAMLVFLGKRDESLLKAVIETAKLFNDFEDEFLNKEEQP